MLATKLEAKVVTEKEWEQLISSNPRYEYVTDENMGFADPKRGKAFVRQTYWPELNKYLLRHEFEHLLEEKGTDEDEHGIRHKRGFLRNAAAILASPFTLGSSLLVGSDKERPLIGTPHTGINELANTVYRYGAPVIGGALGGFGGPLGAAAGAGLGSAVGNIATGQRGVGGQAAGASGLAALGQGLTGGLSGKSFFSGGAPLAPTFQRTNPGGNQSFDFGPGTSLLGRGIGEGGNRLRGFDIFGTTGLNPLTGTAGGLAGGGSAGGGSPPPGGGPAGGLSQFLSQLGQGFRSSIPQIAGQSLGQGLGQFLGSNIGNIGQLTAAAAALNQGLNSPRAQIPAPPDLTTLPRIQNIEQTAGKGLPVSPAGQAGQQDLLSRLNAPFQGVNPLVLQSIKDSFDRQRRDFASQFKTIRPNADIASDYDYARNLSLLDRQEAQAIGDVQQQEFARFQAERTGDISTALGVDRNTLGTLMDIAQLDIDRIQTQFGIDAQKAKDYKAAFGSLAGLLAARPLGLTSIGGGGLGGINLFGR